MWFIAGPQEHLCWRRAGNRRGSEEGCGLGVRGKEGPFPLAAGLVYAGLETWCICGVNC